MNPATRLPLLSALRTGPPRAGPILARRLHLTPFLRADSSSSTTPDAIDDGTPAKGRTGGGEPLGSSSRNAPAKPKISNQSVPGTNKGDKLTEEQQKEVDEHNRDFDSKHDRGNAAADDKVDKKFWSGQSQ